MITKIEINGFKNFENLVLDLRPFTAIVGPNASGKSNLFDALKFLSLLAQHDVRTAMQDLRGEPEELFRRTSSANSSRMQFAVEVVLDPKGVDAFGTLYEVKSQRLRYELEIAFKYDAKGNVRGIFVSRENCYVIPKHSETAAYIRRDKSLRYSGQLKPFIRMKQGPGSEYEAIEIRQDGATKRGRPVTLSANEASRTALSTVSTAEFPHLYALRELFISTRFLEINPQAARKPSGRFEDRHLRSDASNLSAVLAKIRDETRSESQPDGVLSDISADLSSLIPSVRAIVLRDDPGAKEYSFSLALDDLAFSSRVISDGTLRLLALLTALNDPLRKGILCFEEPENGVHEGRIELLVDFLRSAATARDQLGKGKLYQILVNTHSPAVMAALEDEEIVAADMVTTIDSKTGGRTQRTRMRTGVTVPDLFDPETTLTRSEVIRLLKRSADAA
ncbi:AAA family ATPase [Mesorhizobium sp. Cs1299R1N3]|uniref:AAA family ATPase n=1 Tax=Mesorhizobium sp. Cs1299R1N3 TaxID=3015173 RepID=UPI00301CA3C0